MYTRHTVIRRSPEHGGFMRALASQIEHGKYVEPAGADGEPRIVATRSQWMYETAQKIYHQPSSAVSS